MVDVKISALGTISTIVDADVIAIIDDVANTPVSKKATMAQVKTYIGTGMTATSTDTLENKSIDVDDNTITNIEVDNFKSSAIDTDLTSVSGSDDTIPSAKAVKTAIDAKASTVSELTDTTITSVGDNELLQYDSTSSKWINQTLAEAGISPAVGVNTIVTTGALNSGSITSGFGAIDNGASAITTTGTITGGQVTVDNLTINANLIQATNTNGNIELDPNGTGYVEVKGGGSTVGAIRFNCENDSHGQTIKSQPHSVSASNTFLLPTTASNADSVLVSEISEQTLTNKTLTSPQINTKLDILAQGELRLQDASGGQYIGFKAPTTVTDYTLTMPGATGTQGQVLKMSSTSNTLEWGTAGGGAHDEQEWNIYTTKTGTASSGLTGSAYMFTKKIDAYNSGLFITLFKNGASQEVQIC